jgi:hypothetical protein
MENAIGDMRTISLVIDGTYGTSAVTEIEDFASDANAAAIVGIKHCDMMEISVLREMTNYVHGMPRHAVSHVGCCKGDASMGVRDQLE